MSYLCLEYWRMFVCVPVGILYIGLCVLVSVLEWEFMSDLIDGGGSGGSAPLIEATGSTRLLINL